MKLKLANEKDVQLLTSNGPISPRDVEVLRAGITKLFKVGKNKIVLEIEAPGELPNEVLRALGMLDMIARELSGRIVLAGIDPQIRKRIELFAVPPMIECFTTRQEAVQFFFRPPAPVEPPLPAPPVAVPVSVPPPTAAPAQGPAAAATVAPGSESVPPPVAPGPDTSELDAKIKALETENAGLKDRLREMVIERRTPPDAAAYETKIRELEAQVEQLLVQAQSAPQKK